jgi:hypothetical protein
MTASGRFGFPKMLGTFGTAGTIGTLDFVGTLGFGGRQWDLKLSA